MEQHTLDGREQHAGTARTDATTSTTARTGSVDPDPSSTPRRTATAPARFTLQRSRTDRMLGGVCGGLAEALGADAALLRVLVVALTLLTGGAAAVVYLAAWVLAPEDGRTGAAR